MKKIFSLLAAILCLWTSLEAKDGYEIRVKLDNYAEKKLVLGFHLADKQYIKDTALIDDKGWFTFKDKDGKALPSGMYLIITLPEKQYFQVLIDKDEQFFSIESDAKNPSEKIKFKDAPLNESFYAYIKALGDFRKNANKLREQIKKDSSDKVKVKMLEKELDKIDVAAKAYQVKVTTTNPKSFLASIVKAGQDPEVPKFEEIKDEKENQTKRYYYYKQHYFDNIDMTDGRLLRTPILSGKVDYYLDKLVVQAPDSINEGMDRILNMVKPAEEIFKFYITDFLNRYAASKMVGMDACYVHMALNYYTNEKATPWVEKENREKIITNAKELEPVLIGKTAPNLEKLQTRDGKLVNLYDIKSPYTMLLIWSPDCSHCKKEMPDIMEFYEKFKGKGVEIFAICNQTGDNVKKCWEYIDEQKRMTWLNVVDPFFVSNYMKKYAAVSTPQVFILDKNKKILIKKLEVKKLTDGIMDEIIKSENEKMKK
jgi:peroxiredoxin